MGLGVFKNGRYWPITPWQGSWAQQEQERKQNGLALFIPMASTQRLDRTPC